MKLVDTHTHLYEPEFDEDREKVIARAVAAGVDRMLFPAIDSGSHERLFDLCRRWSEYCLPMMGLHPTSVNDNPRWKEELDCVERLLAAPPVERFVAVGEVGLDFYWSRDWQREQEEVFIRQIELSLEYRLPLVIHTRDAWPRMMEILGRYAGCGLCGVLHAFSHTLDCYGRIAEFGDFLFGIGGVVTYRKSGLAEVVAEMDMKDLVLETDSPYLTPVPFRGRRNESAYVRLVCDRVAEIKGVDSEQVAACTTANARRMFGL